MQIWHDDRGLGVGQGEREGGRGRRCTWGKTHRRRAMCFINDISHRFSVAPQGIVGFEISQILLINTLDFGLSQALWRICAGSSPGDDLPEAGKRKRRGLFGGRWRAAQFSGGHRCRSSGRLSAHVTASASEATPHSYSVSCIDAVIMVWWWVMLFKWAVTCSEAQGQEETTNKH